LPVGRTEINGHFYELELEPVCFSFSLDRSNKTLALFWTRQTQFRNILWMLIIVIGWKWPPIKWRAFFTDIDDPA